MRIEDLWELPVESIALPDSALFMWVVSSHLDQALDLGKRWGFTYKAIVFNWVKLYPKSGDLCFGLGKWTRLGSEQCLLFTRGAPKRQSASVPQVDHRSPRSPLREARRGVRAHRSADGRRVACRALREELSGRLGRLG